MLAAAFVHDTSRAKDPALHMHVLIANVTIDPERNEALAMSYGEMFEMRKTLDARIHNNLARRLSALGYTVEVAEHGFRLREIPVAIEEIYSVFATRKSQRPKSCSRRDTRSSNLAMRCDGGQSWRKERAMGVWKDS